MIKDGAAPSLFFIIEKLQTLHVEQEIRFQ